MAPPACWRRSFSESLGAAVTAMHNTPDGRNINARLRFAASGKNAEALWRKPARRWAWRSTATPTARFSSSASGKLVDGDGVLLAVGRYLKSAGKLKGNVIVGTTMANLGLERALEKSGLKLARTAVGDRYVLEEMLRIGANLGGEQSGHILFLDDATTGDGMLTAVKMASLVSIAGPLDALVADLKIFPQKIVNVQVRSKPRSIRCPRLRARSQEAERGAGQFGTRRPALFRHRTAGARDGRSRKRRGRRALDRNAGFGSALRHRRLRFVRFSAKNSPREDAPAPF